MKSPEESLDDISEKDKENASEESSALDNRANISESSRS